MLPGLVLVATVTKTRVEGFSRDRITVLIGLTHQKCEWEEWWGGGEMMSHTHQFPDGRDPHSGGCEHAQTQWASIEGVAEPNRCYSGRILLDWLTWRTSGLLSLMVVLLLLLLQLPVKHTAAFQTTQDQFAKIANVVQDIWVQPSVAAWPPYLNYFIN